MSEPTPSTEDVRKHYSLGAYEFSPGDGKGSPEEYLPGFDRWLAAHDVEVMANAIPLKDLNRVVDHLMSDGTREGLFLANDLNTRFGASARRRAAQGRVP